MQSALVRVLDSVSELVHLQLTSARLRRLIEHSLWDLRQAMVRQSEIRCSTGSERPAALPNTPRGPRSGRSEL